MVILPPKISIALMLFGMCLTLAADAFHVMILNNLGVISMTAGMVAFFVYLLVLVLWEPGSLREPDLRLSTYLRAFFSDWLTIMSGPLSVPLTALALWSSQRTYKILFGSFAVICGIFGSYRVWRKERLAAHAAYRKYADAAAEFKKRLREVSRNAELQWSFLDKPETRVIPEMICKQVDEFCAAVEELYSQCPPELDSQPLRVAIEKLHATRVHRLGNLIGSQQELDQVCEKMKGALADVRAMFQSAAQ